MPLIHFQCEESHITERLYQPFKAEAVQTTTCDLCGKIAQRILATPSPAQFKGTGFYATDYKRK